MFLKNGRSLFQQPALILDRINAPKTEQNLPATNLRESRARCVAMILAVNPKRNTMRLHDDSFRGITLPQQRRFLFVAGDDGVGVPKQMMRLEKESKQLS